MTDQRRYGSDHDRLNNRPADGGRQAPGGDDPLAELTRMVSPGEGQGAPGRGQEPHFHEPHFEDPHGHDPHGHDLRAHGAQGHPGHHSEHDFFGTDDGRGHPAAAEEYPYPETDEEYYARVAQYNAEAGHHGYAPGDEDEGDLPARKRGGLFTILAVLAVAVLGGLGALAYTMMSGGSNDTASGTPPVIEAAREPAKTAPEGAANELPHQNKLIYDRVGTEPNGTATVVGGAEEPGERPVAARPDPSRVIVPGGQNNGVEPLPLDGNAGARRVRTIAIRPDGSVAPPQPMSAPVETAEPTGPIVGTGPAAQGMSMDRGPEFGIMASEPGANAASPSASTLVPMPMARPGSLQMRTAAADDSALLPPPVTGNLPPVAAPVAAAPVAPAASRPTAPANQKTVVKRAITPQPVPPGMQRPRGASTASAARTAAPATSAAGGYSVQLTSQSSEAVARSEYSSLQRRFPAILGGRQPTISPVTLADRGTFYRVRVAAPSQADATNLCNSLKSAGGDCIVQRN